MIRIVQIEVAGKTAKGAFEGTVTFQDGLYVVSADNHFGKSLAVTAIGWCLGLEAMFGLRDDDPSCFPLAARDVIDLDDARRVRVTSSFAAVTFARGDERLRLQRDIVGNPSEVVAEETSSGLSRVSRLKARYRTMKDEAGGLQRFVFEWFGLPRSPIMTNRGEPAEIYLENLAPHFYIDQGEGWATIQAMQVYRYALQDIGAASVEYLLGADEALASRVRIQTAAAEESRLKGAASAIEQQVVAAFQKPGWPLQWSSHGNLAEIVKRWRKAKLKDIARKSFHFDLKTEQARLSERATVLRKQLAQDGIDPKNLTAASDVSQAVIELKGQRHTLREELRVARSQRLEQEQLAESLEHRIHAASDVLRLKTQGIGRLDVVECPTCHRSVDPSTFGLTTQSRGTVEAHIEALKRDRALVLENVRHTLDQVTRLSAEVASIDERLRLAERGLDAVNATAGAVREQLAKTATDLAALERELERNLSIAAEIDELQGVIDKWLQEAEDLVSVQPEPGDLEARRTRFEAALRTQLVALGHSGVSPEDLPHVRLDEEYVPVLGDRRVRSLGSASDHARLIAAYALALVDTSIALHGHHPGFVVFDEPLQQNPDEKHRDLFLRFLEVTAKKRLAHQLIVFTSLKPDEAERLLAAGVTVHLPPGRHFLRRVPPSPVA
ncbi:MAG: hypothetical protein K8M05_20605 [Deltaproteobacteria bacterium]|nr:hypothetical protein [Kofleriaceae bacterium]